MKAPALLFFYAIAAMLTATAQETAAEQPQATPVYPVAILGFSERGMGIDGVGQSVSDIVFAEIVTNPGIYLVERQELGKILDEAELSLTGAVNPAQAVQLGQLTGARIIVTGSVLRAGKEHYVIAKIISTETGRVIGLSSKGPERPDELAAKLGQSIATTITTRSKELVPPPANRDDHLAALKKQLAGKQLPLATIVIKEEHVQRQVIDPAAETEFTLYYRELGGTVLDPASKADKPAIRIVGEGVSEFSTRTKNLVTVKARLEVKAINAQGEIIAADRETVVVVDLNEIIGGKTALQQASARIAARMLPKLAN